MTELQTIQKWLTSIMVRPGMLHDKIAGADSTYQVNSKQLIVSSANLSAEERIGIYAGGYVLRLMECMRADYPMLQNLMGEALFDVFAKAYLVRLPSHSPSLFDLGRNFPDFLKASQPAHTDENEAAVFALPLELAQIERMRVEVSRCEGLEKHQHEDPETDPMFYLFGSARLFTSPCLRLTEVQHDLLDFIYKTEAGDENRPTPIQQHHFLAVCRKNYAVNMRYLEAWQWFFLQELKVSANQQEAVTKTSKMLGIPTDLLSSDLMLWIPVALRFGYIAVEYDTTL